MMRISKDYFLTIHGNGWAYEIEHLPTGETIFVQDYDAEQLQKHTNNFECLDLLPDYFLAQNGVE